MGGSVGKGGSLLDALPSLTTPLHVVMLGLDSAGKTTALYRLKFDQYLNTVPTIGFNCEKIKGTIGKCKGTSFLVWDVGGQEKLRPLWRSYTRCTDGIVFVVDSTDIERMEEAKMELVRTVKSPENSSVPILVLANKQDLPGAKDAAQVEKVLALKDLGPQQLYHVQPTCAVIGEGLEEGLESLYDMICKKKKINKNNHKNNKRK
ncbi:unnamed protein product, partial [Meganyctiphanes norvegica]